MNKPKSDAVIFTKEPYIEDTGPSKIAGISFSTLSEAEISKIGEVQVWKTSYYDSFRKADPGGLLDAHMGPANKRSDFSCATCHGNFADCQGHFGCLQLSQPVFNVGYLNSIVKILKYICKRCARILLDENERIMYLGKMRNPKLDGRQKTQTLENVLKKLKSKKAITCPRCGYINGSVKHNKPTLSIVHDCSNAKNELVSELDSALPHIKNYRGHKDLPKRNLNAFMVLDLFKRMHREDCELLYLAENPENLIMKNIAVPPIVIRPSVMVDGAQSNENDITEKLKKIIHANAAMQDESVESYESGYLMLQFEAAQYINSDVKAYNLQASKPLTGFIQRIKGKQGRFRSNLSGKRVEYTGRTVISPDPNLKITEVAIPIHMACILTYPERVTHHNIEKLRQCVKNGPDKYPGAKVVKNAGGESWTLKVNRTKHADELKFGDIVERHLEDGDIVLFNRQPSLHRMSMMCHRARVMPWRTLRFNESVCNPYNADFDGDEMNLHVPQTEEARTEALLLMTVQNNLCTPKNGEILVASTQDFLTSSFLITRKDTFYDRSTFSLICSYMGDGMDPIDLPTPAIIKPVELWSGKQLFSILLRPHANVRVYVNLTVMEKTYKSTVDDRKRPVKTLCPSDGFVYFRNSELISGQLGKATLGNGNKDGLFSVLLRDYKSDAAASCMNRLAKLSARWIGNHGFSIGIDDVQPKTKLIEKKLRIIEKVYKKCDGFIKAFNERELESAPGCDAAQTLESKIFSNLNGLRDTIAGVCMQTLHWRNSPLIMSQCGSKGSPINICQMVACVGQQSVGGCRAASGFVDRSLPHFRKKAQTPDDKGFVSDSFFDGLSATEFFFHTMAGREGLVDTAVKTADTGYMSRRLMKALEDLFLHYDYTVRDTNGDIVQFCYGDDGMDPAGMEGKNGKPLNFDRLFLRSKAICPSDGDDVILSSSDMRKILDEKLSEVGMSKLEENNTSGNDMSEVGFSADFIKSLRSFVEENTKLTETIAEDDPKYLKNLNNFIPRISGISRRQLEVFLDICLSRYRFKKIEAGTPIGAIGAHSIGEPGTQMTLKTFHFAGVASMNVTLGVPRIKEIIDGLANIKTPIITAILESDDDINTARIVKGRIEKTTLGQVAKSIKVVCSSTSAALSISLDKDLIKGAHLEINADCVKESILETKKLKLIEQNIKVLDDQKLQVVAPKGSLKAASQSEVIFQLNNLKNLLPSVVVKGIKTAERVVLDVGNKDKEVKKFKLLVEGKGLKEVIGVEGVDGHKTITNHVIEMNNVLGIEAARDCIIEQIQYTMKEHGMTIDVRHIMLLADMMTVRGQVLGMTRHGITKMGRSTLMLASFESSTDHLFEASMRGKRDPIEGVSDCIIMGRPIQIGTGMIDIKQKLDPPVLPRGAVPILSQV